MPSVRRWLIPAVAAAAVIFFVAGVVVWRMFSSPTVGPSGGILFLITRPPHRLHPLRAETLWVTSALFALVAISTSLRQQLGRAQRRPSAAERPH
jgi:hypothetical protein